LLVENTAGDCIIGSTGGTASYAQIVFGDSDNKAIGRVRYNNNGDSLEFFVNGAERARFNSSGDFGIGTSSPSYKLDVQTTATGTAAGDNTVAFFGSQASGRDANIRFGDSVNNTARIGYLSGSLYMYTNGAERMRLDSAGNLGLGVTPSNAYTGIKSFEIGANGTLMAETPSSTYNALQLGLNFYYNSAGNVLYKSSGVAASRYIQYQGAHQWATSTATQTAGTDPVFSTLMTLDASGNLLVGKTSANYTSVGCENRANGQINAATANLDFLNMYNNTAGAYRFYVSSGGTINATSITISAISDQRLKENVRDIETGLDAILSLKPRRFDWKEGKGQDKKDVAGFIAQEFETVFPECVSTSKAGEDGIEYKNINHETLIPTLVKAIQELKAELDAYKASYP
jgi:hypothetical protein